MAQAQRGKIWLEMIHLYLDQILTLNQVHVETCSFSPHPQPLSQRATVYTHLGQGINVLRDPPKSPLKRGTLNPAPPFLRGVGGDQTQLRLDQKTCVYTVAPQREGLKPSAYMKRVRENSGFQVRRGL